MRIHLCGKLLVELDDVDATPLLSGRRGRVLLAYLVAHRDRAIRRDELIEVLWPGALPRAPQASLSSLLTGVRRTLGRDALDGRSALSVRLPADVWIDVEAARRLAEASERALALGEAHTALDDARSMLEITAATVLAEFHGDWVERLRAEMDQLRGDQLETAVRAALVIGDAELHTAERLARALVEAEPYRESGYALLMDALARNGNIAEALRTFDHIRVLLRDELGATPAAALTALHERLLTAGRPDAPSPVGLSAAARPPPELPLPAQIVRSERRSFVAREPELERLRARWAEVRQGHGELVLVTGEPGIGKTRLAARFAAEAHEMGAAVVYGRADEETVVPFQPFAEALQELVGHLDQDELRPQLAELHPLLPVAAPAVADARGRRHVMFDAVAELLGRLAGRRPVIVIVEDLHWADKATLLLLRQVVRHAERVPMMVLATYRDVELAAGAPLSRLLADLRREQLLHRVSLAGLDDLGTAALVSARAANGHAVAHAVWLREYTAGNPFFIEELVRSIDETGSRLRLGERHVPQNVEAVILRRFERLPPRPRSLLTWAAVIGREFTLAMLCRLAELTADEVVDELERATAAGLVVEHPDAAGRFSFCHALVRDTIYARPTASRRALLHLRVGELLEAELHDGELAHHYFMARDIGGASRAVAYAVRAGQTAAGSLAYEEAAGHLERALEALDAMPDGDDRARIEVLLGLGAVRWQGGEAGARRAFDCAAELARGRHDGDALVRAALGAGGRFYAPGREDAAYVALLEEALDVEPEPRLRARLLARLAEALVSRPDHERAGRLSQEAIALAIDADDGEALAACLLSRHAALLDVRHLDERTSSARFAVTQADRLELHELAALARHWLVYDLVEAGELDHARAVHEELGALAQELGQPLYRHAALAWRGVWAELGGRYDEAERLAREGLRLAERARAPNAHQAFTAQLLLMRRDQGRIEELLPDIELFVAEDSRVLAWPAFLPLGYLEAGDAEKARAALGAAIQFDYAGLHRLTAMSWLAEAAVRLGDVYLSEVLLEDLAPYSGRLVTASFTGCWGAVDRLLGLLSLACGRAADAKTHLDGALEQHTALAATPLVARTRTDLAMV